MLIRSALCSMLYLRTAHAVSLSAIHTYFFPYNGLYYTPEILFLLTTVMTTR